MVTNDVACLICNKEIQWADTFNEDGSRIYLCDECQEKLTAKNERQRHRAMKKWKNRKSLKEWQDYE